MTMTEQTKQKKQTPEQRIAILRDAKAVGLTLEVVATEDVPPRNEFRIYLDGVYLDRFHKYSEALKHLSVSVVMTEIYKSKKVIWWPNYKPTQH